MNTIYRTNTGIDLQLFQTRNERYYDAKGNRINGYVAYLVSACRRYVQRCEVERLGEFEIVKEAA